MGCAKLSVYLQTPACLHPHALPDSGLKPKLRHRHAERRQEEHGIALAEPAARAISGHTSFPCFSLSFLFFLLVKESLPCFLVPTK